MADVTDSRCRIYRSREVCGLRNRSCRFWDGKF